MMEPNVSISENLLAWYGRHARDLPWRIRPHDREDGAHPDPYKVWLSEIMLQQTTVAAVKSYFQAFTSRWPTVDDLAAANPSDVMSAWAGLGYYARARNLFACAKAVVEKHGSRFPSTATELKTLPGIGDYTSAAIAAIAFDEPAAVVDGNIERVVTRLFEIETPLPAAKPLIRQLVANLTPMLYPGDFAQAMMDLGATICTPRRPACVLCPIASPCVARANGTQERYPLKAAKKARPSRRGAAFVITRPSDGAFWLERRPSSGMLGGMASPPMSQWSSRADGATGQDAAPFPAGWQKAGTVLHGFTHFDLELEVWHADQSSDPEGSGWWSLPGDLPREALPTLMKKVITAALPDAFRNQ